MFDSPVASVGEVKEDVPEEFERLDGEDVVFIIQSSYTLNLGSVGVDCCVFAFQYLSDVLWVFVLLVSVIEVPGDEVDDGE